MYNNLILTISRWFCVLCVLLISVYSIKAGTILLMHIGLGAPSSGPPPTCSNSLDFSQACNSQYIPLF